MLGFLQMFIPLRRVSMVRPAPAELPQDRKVARVGGRSGAISYLLFFYGFYNHKVIISL